MNWYQNICDSFSKNWYCTIREELSARLLSMTSEIALALNTDAGRKILADTMLEPIRRALKYESVGRKLLMVEELVL